MYWFRPRSEQREIQILAVFFGGQDHQRRMLVRLLQKKLRRLTLHPLAQERVIAASIVFVSQRVRDVMTLLEASGRMS